MHSIHVVGSGTIGGPLIELLARHRAALDLAEVTFHKRTPTLDDRPRVAALVGAGARLAVDGERRGEFRRRGYGPALDAEEALGRASVVIDCTPAGLQHRSRYEELSGARGFVAQGSAHGFGQPYALGVNEDALVPGRDRFVQVVSCNSHAIASLVRAIAVEEEPRGAERPGLTSQLESGRFVCIRRESDVGQDGGEVASPTLDPHGDEGAGTHHARDVRELFGTLGLELDLWSSSLRVNSQLMHALWFSLVLTRPTSLNEVIGRLRDRPVIAVTHKRSASRVFSFGRDHGHQGRILNQVVIPTQTLAVRGGREVVGMGLTPQDGNTLLSSVSAALWLIDPARRADRMRALEGELFAEV
ncbi:MAG: hypothetical protein AB7N76_01090 [Planctomycetota bacterium]